MRKVYYDVVMYVNEALKGCGEPYDEATLQPQASVYSSPAYATVATRRVRIRHSLHAQCKRRKNNTTSKTTKRISKKIQ